MNIKRIYFHNNNYMRKKEEVNNLYNELIHINSEIDLEEVKTLTYEEIKELYSVVKYAIDKNILKEIEIIMQKIKMRQYPQLNDVHYYKDINNIEGLNADEKFKLDKLIMEAFNNTRKAVELKKLDKIIIDNLITYKILEKQYVLKCHCDSSECIEKVISENQLITYKKVWSGQYDEISEKELERTYGGCLYVPCWNEGDYEIDSLEQFMKEVGIRYLVIKAPDMTLDNL